MRKNAKPHRPALGAAAVGVLAVGCCAGVPLAVAAIAAVGGRVFGGIAAVALTLVAGAFTLIGRRRPACRRPLPEGPTR